MITRDYFLKNKKSVTWEEIVELRKLCEDQIIEHPDFYKYWNLDMNNNFLFLNTKCLELIEIEFGCSCDVY